MVDLCISGILHKDMVVFSLQGESKTVDQFTKQIHFLLEEKRTYRLYFEQKSAQYIPRSAELMLNILFLPIRGVLNALTFNTIPNWEKDISAFKLSGYIEINLNENTEISFELTQGDFEKTTHKFRYPTISFSPNVLVEQKLTPDMKEITKKHCNHLLNIGSMSILLFALLFYLLSVGFKYEKPIACIVTLLFIIMSIILIVFLVVTSSKKRNALTKALTSQCSKE